MKSFNENRTYGVEIEFIDGSREEIARKIRQAGVACYSEVYNHVSKKHWKVITDSSCGNEIVSPVLRGYEGLNQIRIVCNVLNELGVRVNIRCGLHVHHDANDMTIKNLQNLYIGYMKYEGLIDTLTSKSRRGNNNTYCRSLLGRSSYENMVERIKDCKSIYDIQSLFGTRNVKVNAESYTRHGTIEFRQHQGTTDADKIINWVMFTQLIMERSKMPVVAKIEREYDHLGCLYNYLGIVRKATCSEELFQMGNFFRKRAKELNKEVQVAA